MSTPETWTGADPATGPPATAAQPSSEQVIAGLRATDEGGGDLAALLTPEGERVASPFDRYVADVDAARLRELYREMVLVRRADREANALQRQGQLGIWAPLLGQEAAQIGSARALRRCDRAFPSYREHGVAFARGVAMTELLSLFRCTDQSSWDFQATGMHPYTIVIGNQVLNAVGYAMGQRFDGKVGGGRDGGAAGNGSAREAGTEAEAGTDAADADAGADTDLDADEATIVYFGDGATSQGDVHEGFVWAAVYDAPVVFFCQNNQWAISEPTERQSRLPLYQRARGYGFPGIRVDGNDVLACLAVTRWALATCRSGNGPVLIEAFTYRMDAHTTSDDPTRYRLSEELELWRLKDPIERVRVHLARTAAANQEFFDQIEAEADGFAAELREHCVNIPDPPVERMFSQVYAEPSPLVEAQHADYLDYLAGFADVGPAGGPAEDAAAGESTGTGER